MREFKFRIWDKDLKKFLKNTEYKDFAINTQGQTYCIDGYFDNAKIDEYDCVEISQFTGLKDKHGTEIYEGDIVKFYDIRYTKFMIGKIRFNTERGRWTIYPNVSQGRDLTAEKASQCEVVGNSYQNPELF